MSTTEKLATTFKMLREMHNYTQEYVASALEVSPNTYSLMEKGQATFTIERIEGLAKLYNMNMVDLLNFNGHTVIQSISHSNGILSENVNITNGIGDEERKLFAEVINRLEDQNTRLLNLLEKLSEKL
jgi:transcriptional regulator with XRE-family HTH domain